MTRPEHGSKGITVIAGFVQCAAIAGLVALASCTNGRVAELAPREEGPANVATPTAAVPTNDAGVDASGPEREARAAESSKLRRRLSPLLALFETADAGSSRPQGDVWLDATENDRQICFRRAPASSLAPPTASPGKAPKGAVPTVVDVEACVGSAPGTCGTLLDEWRASYRDRPEAKSQRTGDVLDVTLRGERKFAWATPDHPRFPKPDAELRAWIAEQDGACVYFRLEGNRRDVDASASFLRASVSRTIQGIVGLR